MVWEVSWEERAKPTIFAEHTKRKEDLWFKGPKANILNVERSKVLTTNEQKT